MNYEPAPDRVFLQPQYHELISLIYDAVTHESGFSPFLARFVDVFQGHSASFAVYDLKAGAMAGHWTLNIPTTALAFYATHIAHQDALVEKALEASERGELRFILSNLDLGKNMAEIRRKTRAGEWLESFGAQEAVGAIAFRSDNYLNFFAMQRARHQPDFTREELAVFDLFLPHISRAVGLYTRMSFPELPPVPTTQALNNLQRGILIFDASFRVVFKNDAADKIIRDNSGLNLSDEGLLSFKNREFSERVVSSISSFVTEDQTEGTDTVLRYKFGHRVLTMTIAPLVAQGETELQQRGAIFTLYDWSVRPVIEAETLTQHFGLTEAEARVSVLLLKGESLKGIAGILYRSHETVRSHLRSVFRKTKTSRQGELVALLSVCGTSG